MASTTTKTPINLLRGWPAPDVLPAKLLSDACQRVLADPAVATPVLQYGPNAGHPPLREALAQWLGRHYGVTPDAERICVTNGASQGLATILQSFTDPLYTRAIWIIVPGYFLACAVFEDAGFKGKLRASPEDEEGIDLAALEEKIKALDEEASRQPEVKPLKDPGPARKLYRHVIYTVPTSANPSGQTMSQRRREGLVRLARAHDALVVCDDVYDFLQWPLGREVTSEFLSRMALPRLCDIERAMASNTDDDPQGFGHTVSNGSFSKMAGPGVRTGWAEGSPAFALGLSRTASTLSGGAPSQLAAAILGDLVQNGQLQKHVDEKARPSLQRRHKLIMDVINRELIPLGYRTRESSMPDDKRYGGFFVWLNSEDKQAPPAKTVAEAAVKEENLIIGYGDMFAVSGDVGGAKFDSHIRLCFAWEPEESIVEGVRRLGSLLRRMQKGKLEETHKAPLDMTEFQ